MRFELIVIWSDGDREAYGYDTREQAQAAVNNMLTAFGRQISWTGIREAR